MAEGHIRQTVAAKLIILIIILFPFTVINFSDAILNEGISKNQMTNASNNEIIQIDTYPNGFSDDFNLKIPDGNALDLLEFDLMPDVDVSSVNHVWDSTSDWRSSYAEYENVDYNLTGLRINSPSPSWDFENSNHGWTLDANGGWAWGVDSAGSHGGSKAIYTYLGQYPNQMSTTYYATSPSVDCSSCSGGWNVNFWKQLGVESSSWDHAYFQVKGINGWVTIWENSGSVNDVSYSLQSYRVDSYIAGNSDFRIRFGLGPTDFSVTYDGWNIDDVSITPVSGSGVGAAKVEGSGDANWTTAEIGTGKYHSVDSGPYGLLNIVADIPFNTGLDWTIIDSNSDKPVLGYEQRTELFSDLGRIDWEKHSSIKIKIHLWSDSLESPELKSIILGNVWKFDFNQEPNSSDWIGDVNLISGNFEGSGDLVFPKIFSTKPIISLNYEVIVVGSGQLQFNSDESSNWNNISTSGIINLDNYSKEIQFRWKSNSQNWSFQSIEIEFQTGILPLSPFIDIGKDGKDEWNLSMGEIGFWGSQDRWSDGSISKLVTLSSGTPQYVDYWLPSDKVTNFCIDLTPESGQITELGADLRIGSQIISEIEILNNIGVYRHCLNNSELDILNQNISTNSNIWESNGQGFVLGKIKLVGISQRIQLSGLDILYHPKVEFRENYDSAFIRTINNFLSDTMITNGEKVISIPIFSELTSTLLVEIIDLHSTSGLITEELTLINSTTPLVSSEIWLELESKHSVSEGTIKSIEYDFISKLNQINFVYELDDVNTTISDSSDLIEVEKHSYFESNSDNTSKLRFRINPIWDDDFELELQVRIVRNDGIKGVPEKILIGSNTYQSIENDIEIKSWSVTNDLGKLIPEGMPYLKSGSNITIEVKLGFENISSSLHYPKSGDLEVFVLENGFEIGRTDKLTNGRVSFVRLIPFGPGDLNYEIKLNLKNSQIDTTKIQINRTFIADSLAPKLISTNLERYDYRSPSENQILSFEIFDRPVLPEKLKINLWRDWIDDFNQDGLPSIGEFWSNDMFSPYNLSASSGKYTYVLDDAGAPDGSFVYGYLTGSDSAGNLLVGGGGGELGEELFIYQVTKDSLPQILTDDVSWDNSGIMWLNPGLEYDLSIPFNEKNGINDVDFIEINLDQNNENNLSMRWNSGDSNCGTDNEFIVVTSCNVYSRTSESGPYIKELEFKISFRIKWSYSSDESYINEPSIEIGERSGYSSMVTLPQLRWRFSDEIWIEYASLNFESEKGSRISNNIYVLPNSTLNLEGIISFSRTGENVATNLNIEVGVGFSKVINLTNDGKFNFELISPTSSGNYPLSIDLIDDKFGNFDNENFPQIWIVVDDQSPSIEQILSPRLDVDLSREEIYNLFIELSIKETIMLNEETVNLFWSISEFGVQAPNYLIKDRVESLKINDPVAGRYLLNLNIPLSSYLSSLSIDNDLKFNIWIEGTDAAGNSISSGLNSESNPLFSWTILPYQPMLILSDISYSKYNSINSQDILKVTITVENIGNADTNTNLTVFAKNSDGEFVIAREEVIVNMNMQSSVTIDWVPEEKGVHWVEVRWNEIYLGEGSLISVEDLDNSIFSDFSSSGYVITTFLILFLILLVMLFFLNNSDSEYYEDSEEIYDQEDPANHHISPEYDKISKNLMLPDLNNNYEINQKIDIKQWTDQNGYTWKKVGHNPPQWWDGNSWKDV